MRGVSNTLGRSRSAVQMVRFPLMKSGKLKTIILVISFAIFALPLVVAHGARTNSVSPVTPTVRPLDPAPTASVYAKPKSIYKQLRLHVIQYDILGEPFTPCIY